MSVIFLLYSHAPLLPLTLTPSNVLQTLQQC